MAYNTRRGGAGGYMTTSASSVGQRRANPQQQQQQQLGNNFVSGGQLTQPNKPLVQMPPQPQAMQRQQQAQQQKPPPQQANMAQRQQQLQQQNLRQQAQQFLAQQQQPQIPPQQPQPAPPQQSDQQTGQQPKIVFKVEEKPVGLAQGGQPAPDSANGNDVAGGDSEDSSERRLKKNKPFWMRKDGKINKKERLRRRNQRLRKILQPKNALMVLNELIGSAPYNMTENADAYEGTVFKCTVLVDGLEHIGVGKSKPSAKTAAAEAALKHMVLSKLKNAQSFEPPNPISIPAAATAAAAAAVVAAVTAPADGAGAMDTDGDIKMEIDGEDNLGGISWSHVACYALHKLLSSWDEGSNLAEKLARSVAGASVTISGGAITLSDNAKAFEKRLTNESFKPLLQLAQAASGGSITTSDTAKTFEKRPAKKLPDSAATMNPIMLLNQMHPNAIYEEISKTGNPPNVQFTVKCTVNGEAFLGQGSTKKGARKICAFAACKKVLGIQYAPGFLEEHGFNEDAIGSGTATAPPTVPILIV